MTRFRLMIKIRFSVRGKTNDKNNNRIFNMRCTMAEDWPCSFDITNAERDNRFMCVLTLNFKMKMNNLSVRVYCVMLKTIECNDANENGTAATIHKEKWPFVVDSNCHCVIFRYKWFVLTRSLHFTSRREHVNGSEFFI